MTLPKRKTSRASNSIGSMVAFSGFRTTRVPGENNASRSPHAGISATTISPLLAVVWRCTTR